MTLSRVSFCRCESGGLDVVGDGVLEGSEGVSDFGFGGWFVGVEEGSEEPVAELGVEDGDADPVGGQDVGVLAGDALDQPVQPEAAEVVAHLALRVGLLEVSGDEWAKALVREAGDGTEDGAQGAGQGCCSFVAEAQGSGSLALSMVGLVDALKERRADGTALAGLFDHKQPPVDLAGFVDQFGEVLKAAFDIEIERVVDDRLDPQRATVLQILLDAGVLVAEVDPDLGAGGEDPGLVAIWVGRRSCRANTSETSSGRPIPMLSCTNASKKLRARR